MKVTWFEAGRVQSVGNIAVSCFVSCCYIGSGWCTRILLCRSNLSLAAHISGCLKKITS